MHFRAHCRFGDRNDKVVNHDGWNYLSLASCSTYSVSCTLIFLPKFWGNLDSCPFTQSVRFFFWSWCSGRAGAGAGAGTGCAFSRRGVLSPSIWETAVDWNTVSKSCFTQTNHQCHKINSDPASNSGITKRKGRLEKPLVYQSVASY